MGFLDKFLNVMRLNPDEEEDFFNEDYDFEDDFVEEKPAKSSFKAKKEKEEEFVDDYKEKPVKTTPKITPIRPTKKSSSGAANMELCVIKPTSVEDAREITETLLANRTVVLNLEGIEVDVAQRIIDFTSGSCYAIQGNLQKISHYIFIITPASVDISGDFQEILSGSFDVPAL